MQMKEPINKNALPGFLVTVLIAVIMVFFIILNTGCAGKKPLTVTTKDSTFEKQTPFDTLALIKRHKGKDHTFLNCDSLYKLLAINAGTITSKQDGVRSTITKQKNGSIRFRCETDSLMEVIRLTRIEKNRVITTVKEVRANCERRHITDFEIFRLMVGTITLVILGLWLLLKVLSNYIPILKFLKFL